jgi:hypothetical protein
VHFHHDSLTVSQTVGILAYPVRGHRPASPSTNHVSTRTCTRSYTSAHLQRPAAGHGCGLLRGQLVPARRGISSSTARNYCLEHVSQIHTRMQGDRIKQQSTGSASTQDLAVLKSHSERILSQVKRVQNYISALAREQHTGNSPACADASNTQETRQIQNARSWVLTDLLRGVRVACPAPEHQQCRCSCATHAH